MNRFRLVTVTLHRILRPVGAACGCGAGRGYGCPRCGRCFCNGPCGCGHL